ncbi:unnamed protein product [[Candida] boidinii]|uniref:Unnamed protein product n=1 Tax=Candida boidinii TaxID=5477 RepID=A0ACB5TJT8_CANBO|nr:unnamed protein product [[Candida] boidinii]
MGKNEMPPPLMDNTQEQERKQEKRQERTGESGREATEPLKSVKSKQKILHFGKISYSHSVPIIALNAARCTAGCSRGVAIVFKLPSASVAQLLVHLSATPSPCSQHRQASAQTQASISPSPVRETAPDNLMTGGIYGSNARHNKTQQKTERTPSEQLPGASNRAVCGQLRRQAGC